MANRTETVLISHRAALGAAVAMLCILFSTPAVAEPPTTDAAVADVPTAGAVLVNPLGVAATLGSGFGLVVLDFELVVAFDDTFALSVEPVLVASPQGLLPDADAPEETTAEGGFVFLGGLAGLRIAPTGSGLDGFYVAPALGAGMIGNERSGGAALLTTLSAGYQWTWTNGSGCSSEAWKNWQRNPRPWQK